MFQRVYSALIAGLFSIPVEVECFIGGGLPYFNIVGIGASTADARERIRSALKSVGLPLPPSRITINIRSLDPRLSVSSLSVSCLDLPIALAILACQKLIPSAIFDSSAWFGELSLNGDVRPVNGALTMAKSLTGQASPLSALFFPCENAPEAALLNSADIYGVKSLLQAVHFLQKKETLSTTSQSLVQQEIPSSSFDDIKGQQNAKRCAILSAAGMHHLMLIGPPGCGKTMLSSSIASLMPPLTFQEQLELTEIYSCNHLLPPGTSLITRRPFRSPHHTASMQSLLGGGAIPRAGEVTLAHHGILFLDEFTEIPRQVIESLREPLEEGKVRITRVQGTFEYPCRFLLAAAMNPCPCGYYPDTTRCHCTQSRIRTYYEKINSPITDRIDIMLQMESVKPSETAGTPSITYTKAREAVLRVHKIQEERFQKEGFYNSAMNPKQIQEFCRLNDDTKQFMEDAMLRLGLSMRSYYKVLKVARTIADVEESPSIELNHLLEALQYRTIPGVQ